MIKINLARDVTQVGSKLSLTGFTSLTQVSSQAAVNSKEVLIKLGILLGPVICFMIYEEYNLDGKRTELATLQSKIATIRANVEKLKPEIEEVRRFSDEKGRLVKQMDAIKKLSRERLKNIQALSALQSLIPQKVWLRNLKIQGSKVTIEASAVEDLVVSEFMQGLDQSIFFSNVDLKESQDAKGQEGSTFKDFTVECQLEQL